MRIFEWDEAKNLINLEKHNMSFEIAQDIFNNPTIDISDERFDDNEKRIKSIGKIEDMIILVVIHTDRNGVTRLISARKARKDERDAYYQVFNDGGKNE